MPIQDVSQMNVQHAVPQNIMDVEFKLIGDLTMRQFSYLLIFGVLAYVSNAIVIGIFKWPMTVGFALFGVGLAFVPIEERGMDQWVVNFFRAIYSPTMRVWKKEKLVPAAFMHESIAVVQQEMIALAPTSSRRKLEEYLSGHKDESKVDSLDIPENKYAQMVSEAFAYVTPEPQVSEPAPEVVSTAPPVVSNQPAEPQQEEVSVPKKSFTSQDNQKEGDKEVKKVENRQQRVEQAVKKEQTPVKKQSVAAQQVPRSMPKPRSSSSSYKPMTPDTHSGRVFTNLLPSQGDLVLPIRGERVIKSVEQLEVEEDIKEKALKLQRLLGNIQHAESVSPISQPVIANKVLPPEQVVSQEGDINKEAKEVLSKLKEENAELSTKIQRFQKSGTSEKDKQTLGELEKQKEQIAKSYSELHKRVQDLESKLEKKQTVSPMDAAMKQPVKQYKKTLIRPLTDKPNTISGLVKNFNDNAIPNLLLIVKNQKNEAVRAFKTNSLGQFVLSTPLDNGIYTIEVSGNNSTGLTFDIIPIEVSGGVIPPIQITGK